LKAMLKFEPYTIVKKGGWLGYDFLLNDCEKIDFKYNIKTLKNYPQLIDLKSDKLGYPCYAVHHYYDCGVQNISLANYLSLVWQYNATTQNNFFFELKKKYKTDSLFKKNLKLDVFNSIQRYLRLVRLDITKLNLILINIIYYIMKVADCENKIIIYVFFLS
jgi:hypothetical protein